MIFSTKQLNHENYDVQIYLSYIYIYIYISYIMKYPNYLYLINLHFKLYNV